MPFDDPDSTDPMTLHGVALETEDDSSLRDMALCFVEEYARVGFDGDRIMRMFKTHGYVGPYMALQTLGERSIRAMIDENVQKRGPGRKYAPDRNGNGEISLPVLD